MAREILLGAAVGALAFAGTMGLDLFPILLLGLAGFFLWRLLPASSFGKRSVVPRSGTGPAITFEDIGGQETAKKEMQEALHFLLESHQADKLGIRPLKGILLTGPPGTGKTLLAKAAAHYTDSVFIGTSGSEFIEMYAGVGAQRVRELFARARREAREAQKNAVIFIDEMEVLGGQRGRHHSHLEYDQTLNQLLVEMDGMGSEGSPRILVIGATNRADLMDQALLRPGRFDRIVSLGLPSRQERWDILRLHTAQKPLAPDVDLEAIARETYGFSGAQLESLCNEAAIWALRRQMEVIPHEAFLDSVEKVMLGERQERRPSLEERRRIAIHEMGHAWVQEHLQPGSVARVTITARGQALGYVRSAPRDDAYLRSQRELEDAIAVLLAGSLAEDLFLGTRSTGATSDFKEAVRLAREMVKAGMSPLGVVDPEHLPKALIHRAVSEILAGMEGKVRAMLEEARESFSSLVERLLTDESLTGEEFRQWLAEAKGAPAPIS
ncbi:MAG: AAA family ATPase [Bacillota bacterium]|nr:AAA family ATPase [Bacillota bacterium]